jgi:drug/metabolite transporter (DMT)-like permease
MELQPATLPGPERDPADDRRSPSGQAARVGVLALILVTVVWGTTFPVIKVTVAEVSASVLVLVRFLLAAVAATCLVRTTRLPVGPGLELGFWLWLGYACQAHGLQFTSVGRSAFITSISVVLVPAFVGALGRKVSAWVWLSAVLALAGVALLTADGGPPNKGDAWTVVTAVAYAWYVIRLEFHAAREPSRQLAAAQLWGVVPFAAAWVAADAWLGDLRASPAVAAPWLAILYLALAATALTAWLQTEGQRRVPAPEAAVIYTMEPLWAAILGGAFLGERLGLSGTCGAALILLAVLASQAASLSGRWRAGA